jgi:hypothetical protein
MGHHIVPRSLGDRSDFEHLPAVGKVESYVRVGLPAQQRQMDNDTANALGERAR